MRCCARLLAAVMSIVYLASTKRLNKDIVRLILGKSDTKFDAAKHNAARNVMERPSQFSGTNGEAEVQANFTHVRDGYCLNDQGFILDQMHPRQMVRDLSHCQTKCADSEECQAITYSGGNRFCKLHYQTSTETPALGPDRAAIEARAPAPGVECFNKQRTTDGEGQREGEGTAFSPFHFPFQAGYTRGLAVQGEGEGTMPSPLQANFTRVRDGYCLNHQGLLLDGNLQMVHSLSHCQTICADSEECQAITYSGIDRFCKLHNQTSTETPAPGPDRAAIEARAPAPGVECFNKQRTTPGEGQREGEGTAIPRLQAGYTRGLAVQGEGEGTTASPRQANFTRVRDGYCLNHQGLILNGNLKRVWNLSHCQTTCSDSVECQAITYSGIDRYCELHYQTSTETPAPGPDRAAIEARAPVPGVECWNKQVKLEEVWLNLKKYDRVKVVKDVAGQAHDRWRQLRPYPEEGEHSFQLFEEDLGVVNSVSSTHCLQVGVIFDRNVTKEVWVDPGYVVKDDFSLTEDVNEDLIEKVLETFPQAEDIASLTCPITDKIFIVPVVAFDGRTYEKSALEEASNYSETSVTNYAIKHVLEALTGKDVVAAAAEATAEPESSSKEIEELTNQKKLYTGQSAKWPKRPPSNAQSQTTLEAAAFQCPISHEFFRDPVVASDGITYEKAQIERVLQESAISPFTRKELTRVLIPNRAMKSLLSVLIQRSDLIQRAAHVQ